MYDIIIIGGGPAGLTSAIYARRANKKTLLLESTVCGGQMINTNNVENYPAVPATDGLSIAKAMETQAKELGAEIDFDEVISVEKTADGFIVKAETESFKAKAVIIATGTKPRKLGLAAESKFEGRGISYCATCDGAISQRKPVAVYGGGNSAFYEAEYLSGLAEKVYLIHHHPEFKADEILVEKAKNNPKIEILTSTEITDLAGDKKLEKIITSKKEIAVDALFVAIGRIPCGIKLITDLNLDSDSYIISDENGKTNIPGVFAAGDVREKKLRQIVTATADGAAAANSAIEFLNN